MGKFLGLLALLAFTASCTEFLEENSRVLITGRFVDSSGQPVSGISAKVFRGERSGFDVLNFSSGSIGETVTGVDGRLKLTSFNTQGGDLNLYFLKEQDIYNSVLYNMSIGASSTNLKIELGDVAFVERATLLVNFVNSSGFNGNVPFEILYQDDSCRVFLDEANGAGSLQTSCYETTSNQGEFSTSFQGGLIQINTILNTDVSINYEVNGTTFTETVTVSNQESVYEVNY